MSTDGMLAEAAPRLKELLAEMNQGVTGLAAGRAALSTSPADLQGQN
jgi:hypothetical protein